MQRVMNDLHSSGELLKLRREYPQETQPAYFEQEESFLAQEDAIRAIEQDSLSRLTDLQALSEDDFTAELNFHNDSWDDLEMSALNVGHFNEFGDGRFGDSL